MQQGGPPARDGLGDRPLRLPARDRRRSAPVGELRKNPLRPAIAVGTASLRNADRSGTNAEPWRSLSLRRRFPTSVPRDESSPERRCPREDSRPDPFSEKTAPAFLFLSTPANHRIEHSKERRKSAVEMDRRGESTSTRAARRRPRMEP